jgi:hypothetical protein
MFRSFVQAVLEAVRVSATQKERVLPVLMKQFALNQDDVSLVMISSKKAGRSMAARRSVVRISNSLLPSAKWA